jgi:hypothetical protein
MTDPKSSPATLVGEGRGGGATATRRTLLTGSGVLAAAATIAASLRTAPAQAFQATPAEKAGRYQDSAHVQRFYALNRR